MFKLYSCVIDENKFEPFTNEGILLFSMAPPSDYNQLKIKVQTHLLETLVDKDRTITPDSLSDIIIAHAREVRKYLDMIEAVVIHKYILSCDRRYDVGPEFAWNDWITNHYPKWNQDYESRNLQKKTSYN